MEDTLPFDIEGFDTDNGSEFLNYRLWRYFRERPVPVEFTRSRPYHKNDNAHVEQKQWTHVRQLLGYQRLEHRRLVALINDLYSHEWRALQNFFLPSMRLISKSREGGHWRRRHSAPRTPYERLLDSAKVSQEAKDELRQQFQSFDPFALSQSVQSKLRAILRPARKAEKRIKNTRVAA